VVAESRVAALEVDKHKVALVRLPKGKSRRKCREVETAVGEEVEEEVVGEVGIRVGTSILRAPAGIVLVAGPPVGPRNGRFGQGVVNPNFPLFFNSSRQFVRDCVKWPAGRSGWRY